MAVDWNLMKDTLTSRSDPSWSSSTAALRKKLVICLAALPQRPDTLSHCSHLNAGKIWYIETTAGVEGMSTALVCLTAG